MKDKGRRPGTRIARLEKHIKAAEYPAAEQLARQIVTQNPAHVFALKALAVSLVQKGSYGEAEALLQRALTLAPQDVELHVNLGVCFFEKGQSQLAIAAFEAAIRLDPCDASSWLNLGRAWRRLGQRRSAITAGQRAVELKPRNPEAQLFLGEVLAIDNQHQLAIAHLLAATEHFEDDNIAALEQLSASLCNLFNHEAAVEILTQLHEHYPGNLATLCRLISCRLFLVDWVGLDELLSEFSIAVTGTEVAAMDPSYLAFPGLSPQQHKWLAQSYAGSILSDANARPLLVPPRGHGNGPLRIGYLSADFNNHATSQLLVGVIERHDRSSFKVFAYSSTQDDQSDLRKRIETAFDVFVDIQSMSDDEAASQIASDQIDILIDLKGWTRDSRMGILAFRPAPIQITWLGYPGTIGSTDFVDYQIGDPVVSPLAKQCDFAEKLLLLPHCYQPNDSKKPLEQVPSRMAAGLPPSGFVFCSFNQSYKFNARSLDLWGRLLHAVPGSVLWLWRPGAAIACENLQRELLKRGIPSERLIFAPGLPLAEHLARLQLADLALDTFPVNSHTTASDALWAGVPMVTLLGETFAGRVGASLLHAIGLADFIAADGDQYVQIARDYALDPARQQSLRRYLVAARTESKLFDTVGFTRDLEQLYRQVWREHFAAGAESRRCNE